MASKLNSLNLLLRATILAVLNDFAISFSTPGHKEAAQWRSLENPASNSTDQQAVRLHPGVIASVVFVVLCAVVSAVFIIRKYCCQQSNATYRYSELREQEERNAVTEQESDSDEDLLE